MEQNESDKNKNKDEIIMNATVGKARSYYFIQIVDPIDFDVQRCSKSLSNM